MSKLRILHVNNSANPFGGTYRCAISMSAAIPEAENTILLPRIRNVDSVAREMAKQVNTKVQWSTPVVKVASNYDVILYHNSPEHSIAKPANPDVYTIYVQHSLTRKAITAQYCNRHIIVSSHLYKQCKNKGLVFHHTKLVYQPVGTDDIDQIGVKDIDALRVATPKDNKWNPKDVDPYIKILKARGLTPTLVGVPLKLHKHYKELTPEVYGPLDSEPFLNRAKMMFYQGGVSESFGRTLAEAQKNRCVPIVNKKGGFIEQINDGSDKPYYGLFADSESEFATAVDEYLENRLEYTNRLPNNIVDTTLHGWRNSFVSILRGQ